MERCADFGLGDSLLEKEALAAIREVGFAVRMISLPESLPRTADLIFMNLITLEGTLVPLSRKRRRLFIFAYSVVSKACKCFTACRKSFQSLSL